MGGPAWSYDDVRQAWYLHLFEEKQPDLDWRNPEVREAVTEMITWWLEKGIDGLRLDAVNYLSKAPGLPDGDPTNSPVGIERFGHGPRIHEYLRGLYDDAFSAYDVVIVAEMAGTTVEMAREYLGENGDGLDMIFQFEHMGVDIGPGGRWGLDEWGEWDLRELKEITTRWQKGLEDSGWNALYLGNHDQPRIVSRFGDEEFREASATLLATFLLTLRGTPYVYQGEEIGMTNAEFESLDSLDDPMTVGAIEELLERGAVDAYEDVQDLVNYRSRDHSRTPMQWDRSTNAGFNEGEPWFALNENYTDVNVAAALAEEHSIYQYYRALIDLRDAEDVLVYGSYDLLVPDEDRIYAYTRTLADERALIVLNWSAEPTCFDPEAIEPIEIDAATVLLGNYEDRPADPPERRFRPYEAAVYRL